MEDAIHRSYVFREVLVDRNMVQLYIRGEAVEVRGQAADEQERALIVDVISAVVSPLKVQNRLFVDSDHRRSSDRWLAHRLRSAALMIAGVDPTSLDVVVSPERVALRGTVNTEEQRNSVQELVRVLSRTRPVETAFQLASTPPAAAKIDEPSVLAMAHHLLASLHPEATFAFSLREGQLTVEGIVPDAAVRAQVERWLATVRGVVRVNNRVRVEA